MRSLELFTGAGGLALGIHRAGFDHLAVVESDRDACDTLRLNARRAEETGIVWPVVETDVCAFDYARYGTDVDLLAGGPPCQPWSLGGKHGGDADQRNLFPELFRAVRVTRPRALLVENVRGMMREAFSPYFAYILAQARCPFIEQRSGESWHEHHMRLDAAPVMDNDPRDQYDVAYTLANAADFGVPQERHRVFIVAFRRDLGVHWTFPHPTHSADALLYAQYVDGTYWHKHDDTPRATPPHLASRVARLATKSKPLANRWRTVRDAICDLPEPRDYERHPIFDNHVGIPDARPYPGHTGSPWDWPAKTIKAGDHGNPGGENMLRRDDGSVRYFTVRELARLQTFPNAWHFANSWTESRRQLGNAVPVMLGEVLARRIFAELAWVDEHRAPTRRESVAELALRAND